MNSFSNLNLLCILADDKEKEDIREITSFFPVFRSVKCISSKEEALKYIQSNSVDIILMDYFLNNFNNSDDDELTFSDQLHRICPTTNLIFVSDKEQDAYDAWKTSAVGFILKPVNEDDIIKQLLKIYRYCFANDKKLVFRCFGNFECFFKGEPVKFDRKQCKEFLAYLIDRQGAQVSESEIRAILWEDAEDTPAQRSYLRTLASSIRKTFEDLGQEDVFINNHGTYRIDLTKVYCDYYEYLNGNKSQCAFRGEYMNQYSWAEETTANLEFDL